MLKTLSAKQAYIKEVEALKAQLSPVAREYFEKTVCAQKVNKSEQYKSERMRAVIFNFLKANEGKLFTRDEIAKSIADSPAIENSDWIFNEKNELKVQSVSSFANILVAQGNGIVKESVKVGNSEKVKYSFISK